MKTATRATRAARDPAAPLNISTWINSEGAISLDALRGRVIVLHAFQMLCPGCVSHGIPQAIRLHQAFNAEDVVVLGLHTVFEHHHVMGPDALKVFMHEYRIPFPVGVDQAVAGSDIPLTMQAYGLRGTPSLVVIDRNGCVALNHFGHLDDLPLGALLGQLVSESVAADTALPTATMAMAPKSDSTAQSCTDNACGIEP